MSSRGVDPSTGLWLTSGSRMGTGFYMSGRFCALAVALLLAACSSERGLRCEYSSGNLDKIKQQVATLKSGGTTASEVANTLGKPTNISPTPDGGKAFEYNFP